MRLRVSARLFALGWLLGASALSAQPAPEPLRPEVAKPLQAAQEAIRAGQGAQALARVREAEAVPQPNAQERYLILRLRAPAAALAGEHGQAVADFEAVLASDRLPAAERPALWQALLQTAQRANDPAAVVRVVRAQQAEGAREPRLWLVLAQAQATLKNDAGVVQALQSLVADDEAAGRPGAEAPLKLLAATQLRQGDEAGYQVTLERLVRLHPQPAYWADRLARLRAAPGFPPRLQLDSWRLARQANALLDADDMHDMVRLAVQAGLPAEALAVLDEGVARGWGTPADKAQRAALQKAVADDRSQLSSGEAAARQAPDSAALFGQGLALFTMGQTDPGLQRMSDALARGIARQTDEARLRLAVARWQAGQREAAQAEWRALAAGATGAVATLARLWLLLRPPS
ncbi:hypothetical protein KAK06_18365 [Ideonella sp. 4Y11]|uniref:Tetratricopeptide repeat protein n=1 Tax=Ideonella aquatica TaxID=2824119 RepID=A0A941BHH9_9BURK|nr:hypothetical protein [Ideonella aquatica]MBQ0960926.1 hypothetical protein [Ideonella aquatica]